MSTREVCGVCAYMCIGRGLWCQWFFLLIVCIYVCVCDLHKIYTQHPIIHIYKRAKYKLISFHLFRFLSLARFLNHTSRLQHFHSAELGEVSFVFPALRTEASQQLKFAVI